MQCLTHIFTAHQGSGHEHLTNETRGWESLPQIHTVTKDLHPGSEFKPKPELFHCKSFMSTTLHSYWALTGLKLCNLTNFKISCSLSNFTGRGKYNPNLPSRGRDPGEQILGNKIRLVTTKFCGPFDKDLWSSCYVLVPGNMQSSKQKKILLT